MTPGRIRLLEDGPTRGARNMAVDEALMGAARAGLVTFRLYRWNPPCLSLGRNERAHGAYDQEEAAHRGIDIVRRPTGGRAVYHDDELTYAVTAPAGLWGGLRESYVRINRALARGLRALGVSAETCAAAEGSSRGGFAPSGDSGPAGRACFAEPAPGEVTAAGRKLIGSALWRHRGALLQHGSILLSDGQATVAALRSERARTAVSATRAAVSAGRSRPSGWSGASPAASAAESPAVGLEELLGRRPALTELRGALVAGFEEELESGVESSELSRAERAEAARLTARYRGDAWTWRR